MREHVFDRDRNVLEAGIAAVRFEIRFSRHVTTDDDLLFKSCLAEFEDQIHTLEIGQVILAFAGLGFLGLGAVPPAPEWGATINEARNYLFLAPQLTLYPGTAILLAVLGFNLLGDGLRDAFDPKGPSGSSGKKN